jgi:hypothetical protein
MSQAMTESIIPRLLEQLISEGRWPRDSTGATAQIRPRRIAKELVQLLAPEEDRIDLIAPPFRTVRERVTFERFWTWPMADPGGIDFDLSLVIGDFGMGSDAPIILDYREDATNPRVLRLRWASEGRVIQNRWVVMAPDFPTFVATLQL